MRLDPALCERLAPGELALCRYVSWQRDCGLASPVAGAEAAAGFGLLEPLGEGHVAALAPGRWVWIATAAAEAPFAAAGSVCADLSASVIGYRIARSRLDGLLRRHAPATLDCDLLAPGFRRIGFASWTIELAILPDRPAIALVPRGHADNFDVLASARLAPGSDSKGTSQ
jgi:hypothetical protein